MQRVKSEGKRFWKTCVREDISKIFKKEKVISADNQIGEMMNNNSALDYL